MNEKFKKPALIAGAVILVVILAAAITGAAYYNAMLNKITHVEVPEIVTTAPTEVTLPEETTVVTEPPHVASSADYLNILLVGQSARPGEDYRMADTMILCTINTYEKTVRLTSLLRDTLVKMPDFKGHYGGNIKLTTVYHLGSYYTRGEMPEKIAGSMEIINQCLYDNFGIEVDYNFEVGFDAFIKVVDMLDGVNIELTEAEAQYLNKDDLWVYYDVEPGMTRLDGMAALSYARMRKANGDGESDIKRTARQRKLLGLLLDKVREQDFGTLYYIAEEVLPYVATSMDNQEITDTLMMLLPMLPELELLESGTCPAEYSGSLKDIYGDGMLHSVLWYNKEETKKAMRAMTEGEGLTEPTEPATEPAAEPATEPAAEPTAESATAPTAAAAAASGTQPTAKPDT